MNPVKLVHSLDYSLICLLKNAFQLPNSNFGVLQEKHSVRTVSIGRQLIRVLSDSGLRFGAMYDASNKFTERWISRFVDKSANFDPHGNGSRLAASQQEPTPLNCLRFKFHVSPAAKTTEIKREIENVLGARPLSESIHRVLLLGIINEIPIHEHARPLFERAHELLASPFQ